LTFGLTNILLGQEALASAPKAAGDYLVEVVLSLRALKELQMLVNEAVKVLEMRWGEIKLPKRPEDIFKQP
jgi:hypothetical protein